MKWLKEGDRNTKFFHVVATQKMRKCKIHRIQDGSGGWLTDQEVIPNAGVDLFEWQFAKESENLNFEL